MKENINLESERLIYQRLSNKHVTPEYVGWLNDNDVNTYLETRGNYTLDMLKTYVEDQYDKQIYFWAVHLKDSNKHIGNIKIDPIDFEKKKGEYGILMGDKKHWGKGYAKEASIRIIKYCFEELELNKITLGVIEDNLKAVMLYKKLNFEITERKEKTGVYNNKMCNALRMCLKKEKFEQ